MRSNVTYLCPHCELEMDVCNVVEHVEANHDSCSSCALEAMMVEYAIENPDQVRWTRVRDGSWTVERRLPF